jgi:putative hydrolase of the HAD superfamily
VSARLAPQALLIDFGGVLTSSPFAAFEAFCRAEGLPPDAVRNALSHGEGATLLVGVETGAMPEEEFEDGLAALLSVAHHTAVAPEGLLGRLHAGLTPEPATIAATLRLRRAGITTVLVSNSLGYDPYDTVDLPALFDHVVLSGRLGARKPSRSVYRHAAQLAGVAPEDCLMVDDLEHNLVGAERVGMQTLLHVDVATTVTALDAAYGARA